MPLMVLLVVTRLNIGGVARHVLRLAKDLGDAGHSVAVATGQVEPHEGDMSGLADAYGVQVVHIPGLGRSISWRDDWRAFLALRKLVKELRPDVVHTHTAKAGTLGRIVALLARTRRIVHTYHGHVFHGYFSPVKTAIILSVERTLAWGTDHFIALSKTQQNELSERYRIAAAHKFTVIPLGISAYDLGASQHNGSNVRDDLNLPPAVKLVAAVGRIVPIKNPGLFLNIAKICCQQEPVAHFIFVGRGEAEQETQRMAQETGLAGQVHFLGWRDDLASIYSQIDALLITSQNEGTPYSILEAMSLNCPVVATKVGGVPDMIRHEETGLLFDSGDSEAGAAAILRVLRDEAVRNEIADAARFYVRANYSHERVLQQILDVYCGE